MQDDIGYGPLDKMRCCDDWTAIKVQPWAYGVSARLMSRVLVGPALCRNEEWLTTFTKDMG
jgi:ent-kaurene oxidase